MCIGPKVQSPSPREENHINKLLIIPGHLSSFIGGLHQAKQSPKLPCPHSLIPQSCSSHKALSWFLRGVSGKASSGRPLALPLLPSLQLNIWLALCSGKTGWILPSLPLLPEVWAFCLCTPQTSGNLARPAGTWQRGKWQCLDGTNKGRRKGFGRTPKKTERCNPQGGSRS